MKRSNEDLAYILQFVEGALVAQDDAVFFEFPPWLGQLLTARGLPASIVPTTLGALAAVVPGSLAHARSLLEQGEQATRLASRE